MIITLCGMLGGTKVDMCLCARVVAGYVSPLRSFLPQIHKAWLIMKQKRVD